MNRIRLIAHRLFRRPTVTGPYRVYVRRTPAGAMLDVEHYLIAVIETIADNPDLMDLLTEIEEDRRNARTHRHDGWEPEELLVEKLTTALGYELPVHGREVMRLAYRLRRCTPLARPAVGSGSVVSLPAQRREGGAAA
jgi:hypothetical protein